MAWIELQLNFIGRRFMMFHGFRYRGGLQVASQFSWVYSREGSLL